MICVLCFLILHFLVCSVTTLNSKSVNLNLETILQFDQKNLESDVKIIDDVQKFLSKIRHALDKNMTSATKRVRRLFRRSGGGHTKDIKFTEFLENVLSTLTTFSDDQLEELVSVIDDEFRKYHYKGCKFYELVQASNDFRSFVGETLEAMRHSTAKKLKKKMHNMHKKLRNHKFNKEEADHIDYINSLYLADSKKRMYDVLTSLKEFNKHNLTRKYSDLVKMVRKAVRSIIFDHYSNLNVNARKEIKTKVSEYFSKYARQSNTNVTSKENKTNNDDDKSSNKDTTLNDRLETMENSVRITQMPEFDPETEAEAEPESRPARQKHHKKHSKAQQLTIEYEPENTESPTTEKHRTKRHKLRTKTMSTTTDLGIDPKSDLEANKIQETEPPATQTSSKKNAAKRHHVRDLETNISETETPTPVNSYKKVKKHKTKLVVSEGRPLHEILTEHNAVIKVDTLYTTSKSHLEKQTKREHRKKKHGHRHKSSTTFSSDKTTTEYTPKIDAEHEIKKAFINHMLPAQSFETNNLYGFRKNAENGMPKNKRHKNNIVPSTSQSTEIEIKASRERKTTRKKPDMQSPIYRSHHKRGHGHSRHKNKKHTHISTTPESSRENVLTTTFSDRRRHHLKDKVKRRRLKNREPYHKEDRERRHKHHKDKSATSLSFRKVYAKNNDLNSESMEINTKYTTSHTKNYTTTKLKSNTTPKTTTVPDFLLKKINQLERQMEDINDKFVLGTAATNSMASMMPPIVIVNKAKIFEHIKPDPIKIPPRSINVKSTKKGLAVISSSESSSDIETIAEVNKKNASIQPSTEMTWPKTDMTHSTYLSTQPTYLMTQSKTLLTHRTNSIEFTTTKSFPKNTGYKKPSTDRSTLVFRSENLIQEVNKRIPFNEYADFANTKRMKQKDMEYMEKIRSKSAKLKNKEMANESFSKRVIKELPQTEEITERSTVITIAPTNGYVKSEDKIERKSNSDSFVSESVSMTTKDNIVKNEDLSQKSSAIKLIDPITMTPEATTTTTEAKTTMDTTPKAVTTEKAALKVDLMEKDSKPLTPVKSKRIENSYTPVDLENNIGTEKDYKPHSLDDDNANKTENYKKPVNLINDKETQKDGKLVNFKSGNVLAKDSKLTNQANNNAIEKDYRPINLNDYDNQKYFKAGKEIVRDYKPNNLVNNNTMEKNGKSANQLNIANGKDSKTRNQYSEQDTTRFSTIIESKSRFKVIQNRESSKDKSYQTISTGNTTTNVLNQINQTTTQQTLVPTLPLYNISKIDIEAYTQSITTIPVPAIKRRRGGRVLHFFSPENLDNPFEPTNVTDAKLKREMDDTLYRLA